MKLNSRRFGQTGLNVSTLCLGTSNFARYANQEESFAILDLFRGAGGNFVQTSGICPGINLGDGLLGLPEKILGRWLSDRHIPRSQFVIATRLALIRPVIGGFDGFVQFIKGCVEDSVRRIGCDYLDFLVVEWTDAISPVTESMAAFEKVISTGLVRSIVPANFPAWSVCEALNVSRSDPAAIAALQIDYSLVVRAPLEVEVTKYLADYNLAVVTRSPLAGGYLADETNAVLLRQRGQADRGTADAAANFWPTLSAIAHSHRCAPAQVSLAWVLTQSRLTSVLISVRSTAQLIALIAATRLQLKADDIVRLSSDVK